LELKLLRHGVVGNRFTLVGKGLPVTNANSPYRQQSILSQLGIETDRAWVAGH